MPSVWVEESVVLALHEEHLAEHGGAVGIRDRGLLESALFRPRNLAGYDNPDLAALAAAYGFGLIRNHPFIDGKQADSLYGNRAFSCLERTGIACRRSGVCHDYLKLGGRKFIRARVCRLAQGKYQALSGTQVGRGLQTPSHGRQ